MKKAWNFFTKTKIDLRDLLRFNTAIVLSVFAISSALVCWRTYDFLLASNNKEINTLLDQEMNLLNVRFDSYRINLENLKAIINQDLQSGNRINPELMSKVMTSIVAHQPYVYNAYFALSPEYAKRNFNQGLYVLVNHKDIKFLNSEEFSKEQNIVHEIDTSVDYVNEPKEVWYHIAKKGPEIQMTDPYYDASYMKVTMFSLVTALQGANGEFAGVVGIDMPMSLWLNENFKRSAERGYRVLIVNQQGQSLESLLQEKFTFEKAAVPAEFQLEAKNRTFSTEKQYEFTDDRGKVFDAQSRPILDNKYYLTVIRDRARVVEPLKVFFLGIAFFLLTILIIHTIISRFVSSAILKNVSRLFENFKLNSNNLRLNKGNFEPQHLDELRIKELDNVRVFWDSFLEEFRQALGELRDEKEKSDKVANFQASFLANMSHEIRTPMNAIVGMTDMLSETSLNDDQRKYLEIFKRSTHNLLNLLNDILDVAKIESGNLVIENINTDIERMREDVLMMFTNQARHKNLTLNFEIAADVPKYVVLDSFRLRQILFNLVGNAIKFTDRGHVTVKFYLGNQDKMLCVDIVDSGIGIPQYKINDIFKKFTQADTSTTRKFGGTGLGLSIVHSLVYLMNGTIELESQEGLGSLFKVRLPFEEVDTVVGLQNKLATTSNAKVTFDQKPILPRSNHVKILLVDDVYENRMIIQLYLKAIGLDYEMAMNGQEAVDQYGRGEFDIVLMDIQMPIKDGVTAMKEIKLIQKIKGLNTQVIALTAFASPTDNEKYMSIGFDGYLSKPLTKKTFTEALAKYIN